MPRITRVHAGLIAGQLLLLATALGQTDERTLVIASRGDVTVRLVVREQASLLDQGWLRFELENRSGRPLALLNASYRFERLEEDSCGGLRLVGSLASGSSYDLLVESVSDDGSLGSVLPPGVTTCHEGPSDYSAALLAASPGPRRVVHGRLFFELSVQGQGRVSNGSIAHEFEFTWQARTPQDQPRLEERLRTLLAEPRRLVSHEYLLGALLASPDLAETLTADEVIEAIERRPRPLQGRVVLLKLLGQRHGKDPQVVEYFLGRLATKDDQAARDLASAPGIWDERFLEPLLERFEANLYLQHPIFRILERAGLPQRANPKLSSRLSAAVLKHRPLLQLTPEHAAPSVSLILQSLAQTHDSALASTIAPFLENTTRILELRLLSVRPPWPPPAVRVCDAALDALLTIRDGDRRGAFDLAARRHELRPLDADLEAYESELIRLRNAMILEVKRQLDGR